MHRNGTDGPGDHGYRTVWPEDIEDLESTGLITADNGESYWIMDIVRTSEFEYSVPYINSNGEYCLEQMCSYTNESGVVTKEGLGPKIHGARSVLTFQPGILDKFTGSGTEEAPLILSIADYASGKYN